MSVESAGDKLASQRHSNSFKNDRMQQNKVKATQKGK